MARLTGRLSLEKLFVLSSPLAVKQILDRKIPRCCARYNWLSNIGLDIVYLMHQFVPEVHQIGFGIILLRIIICLDYFSTERCSNLVFKHKTFVISLSC